MSLMKTLRGRLIAIILACVVLSFVSMGAGAVEVTDTDVKTYPAVKCSEVIFVTSNGLIDVETHAGDTVRVEVTRKARSYSEARAKWLLEKVQIRTSMSNGQLTVRVQLPSFFAFLGGTAGEIRALVPASWQGTLRLSTSNGSINVTQLRGHGDFHTSNGAITVAGWHGSLEAKTSNGRVEAAGLFLNRESAINTSNGSITLQVNELSADLSLRTSNGSIKLTAPQRLGVDLTADTSNGVITVRGFGSAETTAKKSYSTKLNNGGPNVEAHSSNGSITIETLNGL